MKGADLIIDDPSISTPHALMRVSGEKGLHVEDLMSECGVFVRAQDGAAYQREEDAVLRHGDWVRFGDVEYVVTLAAPGPK
jgi:pSer/pThr/pTyr-binding forkhead associated (FHA) protein